MKRLRPSIDCMSRLLWIDAICINQTDIDERNAQVAIMGDIYKEASRVLVWLENEVSTTPEIKQLELEFHSRNLNWFRNLVEASKSEDSLEKGNSLAQIAEDLNRTGDETITSKSKLTL